MYEIRKTEFRDPIHGFIDVYPHERQIIDTVEFQRLRRIHQLGLTHYIYHGAEHSRFGHSLGVMHLAGRAAESLIDRNIRLVSEILGWCSSNVWKEKRRLVLLSRLAGLVHDVGHAPFSHTGEDRLFSEGDSHEKVMALPLSGNLKSARSLMQTPLCRESRITKEEVASSGGRRIHLVCRLCPRVG